MIAQSLLPEFDHEIRTTRSVLERVPDSDADWKPHPKSMSLGELASHVGNLVYWATITMRGSEFDLNPPDGEPFRPPRFTSAAELVTRLDELAAGARALIASGSDEQMMESWTLLNGGNRMLSMPRVAILRSFFMNHLIHHRGQLTVYLRMRDVPLPSVYGPTADEPRF